MSPLGARLLVFFTAAAVLVMEILAGRLLAPYVGVTLETFTGIIGTVLAGISLGAWIGGRMADRYPPRRLLGPALIGGGVLVLLAPTIVAGVGPALTGGGPLEIVTLAFAGFFAPALILSTVTPIVAKITLDDLAETGTVVGGLSAVGTAGAIFGTFLTGFVLLAALPSRPIVLGVGIALVIAGTLLAVRAGRLGPPGVAAVAAATLAGSALLGIVNGPCQFETPYFCARVTVDELRDSGRVLWLDTLRHSYVDLRDPAYLEFRYARLVADTVDTAAPDGPLDALYIGGGGFTLPRWLSAERPGSTNTVLELDPSLVDIAEAELGLIPGEIDEIAIGDARLGIAETPEAGYDLVVGDAFGGLSVPWHLTTREFVEDIASRLSPDGVYVMNLIDYPPFRFAKAEAATLAEVFPEVVVMAPPDYLDGNGGGNIVLAAGREPFDVAALEAAISDRAGSEVALTGDEAAAWIGGSPILTDDFAPVDQWISRG
jgi:spermidine synthase